MQFYRLAHWLRIPAIALFSVLLVSCGSGGGEDPVEGGTDDTLVTGLRLVFEDDFGGPAGAPRTAGKLPLSVDKWRAVTGRGPGNDGWGNNEWQTYQNSIDNLYIEDNALVIEARCDTAPACNNGDGSVTSARITTKDKFEIKYGNIQARIKVPGQRGMWPAFWMLGKDWPESDWPDVGEIDIMEMLYGISDPQTVHFSLHWAGPNDAPTSSGCSGVPGAADPVNEIENCFTKTKEFNEPLSNDYHIYEVIWNERTIIGKIDGITYFSRAIDPATMEEFQGKMYMLLNLGVGGAGGDPSNVDWTDPQKVEDRQMKVDWVRVYEAVLPPTGTLIAETGRNLDYNRVIQSQEFQGNEVTADLNSTAVPALEGSQVLQVDYTNSTTGNTGGPNAGFGGIFFSFNSADATYFTNLVFSIDTSAFPGFDDMTIEVKDTSDTALQVLLSDPRVTSTSGPGNWKTYNVPLSAFAGVDISRVLFLGFLNPVNAADQLINGTLYIDDIRLVNQACAPNATVAFDAVNYRPDASVAQITVNDTCAANSVVPVKVETGTEEIVVGVDLDAAGHGKSFLNFVSTVSACPTSDENSIIALTEAMPGALLATYANTYYGPNGSVRIDTATATAGVDPAAIETDFAGEEFYFYATDTNQNPLTFVPDSPGPNGFNYSFFTSGTNPDGSFTDDARFSPVWRLGSGTGYGGEVAQMGLINLTAGFAAGKDSINFKFKNLGSPNDAVIVTFGGDSVNVDLADNTRSTRIDANDDWYEIKVPMSEFPDVDNYTSLVFASAPPNPDIGNPFAILITDIYLEGTVGATIGAECDAPVVKAPTPTEDPMEVISLLSSAYSPGATVDTWRTVWSGATLTDVQLEGDDIKRYTDLGFVGIETVTNSIDATGMTNFRIDVWSPDVTQLLVKWVDFGGDGFDIGGNVNDTEGSVTLPLTPGQWVSLDIPISSLIGDGLTATPNDLSQLILEAIGGTGTIYVSNVYFYNVPVPPLEPSVFSTVVYDEAYADVWAPFICCGGATIIETAAADTAYGNVVDIDYTAGNTIAGLQYGNGPGYLDVSAYAANGTLEFDALVTRLGNGDWKLKIEDGTGGAVEVPFTASNEGVAPALGVWQHYTFDIAAALSGGSVNWSNVKLLLFFSDFASGQGQIQLDNIEFREPAEVVYQNAYEDVWTTFICCGGTTIAEVPATDTAFGNVIDINYTAGGTISGLQYGSGPTYLDVSTYATGGTLEFDALVTRLGNGDWKLKIEDGTGGAVEVPFTASNEGVAPALGVWQHYTFDIAAALSGGSVDWSNVKLLLFFSDFASGLGQIQLDNIGFRPSSGGGGGGSCTLTATPPALALNGDFETGDFSCWTQFVNLGDQTIVTDPDPNKGNVARLFLDVAGNATVLKQQRIGTGIVSANDTINFSFDYRGTGNPGAVLNVKSVCETAEGSNAPCGDFVNTLFPTPGWQNFTGSFTLVDMGEGVESYTLEFAAATGGAPAQLEYFIDNVIITISP